MAEGVLDRIVGAVRQRLQATPPRPDLAVAARCASDRRLAAGRRSLEAALRARGPSVIAECKHASPSAGVLREPFDPLSLATAYEAAGAAAISVVTEPDFFAGEPAWIPEVRAAVGIPVLRKDFIVSVRQVQETAAMGADAMLLIQRILNPERLAELLAAAADLHLDVLLEVFTDEDPAPSVASGAAIIGVNARNLATFETRLDRVAELAAAIPDDRVKVAESGIRRRGDLESLQAAGYDAFLIGEHLVRSHDPGAALVALRGGE